MGPEGFGVQVALSLVNKIQASSCLSKSHSLFNMRENLGNQTLFSGQVHPDRPLFLQSDCKFSVVLNLDRREHTWGRTSVGCTQVSVCGCLCCLS